MDEVLKQQKISHVDLIKIDVEGFEMEVLKGCERVLSLKNGPILVVECSNTRNNYNYGMVELFDFLTVKHGYKIYKFSISKEKVSKLLKVTKFEELPDHDNILAFKEHHFQILNGLPKLF